jgi:hypothetical protein
MAKTLTFPECECECVCVWWMGGNCVCVHLHSFQQLDIIHIRCHLTRVTVIAGHTLLAQSLRCLVLVCSGRTVYLSVAALWTVVASGTGEGSGDALASRAVIT